MRPITDPTWWQHGRRCGQRPRSTWPPSLSSACSARPSRPPACLQSRSKIPIVDHRSTLLSEQSTGFKSRIKDIQFHVIFLPFWSNNIYRVVWIAMQCIVQRSSPAVYVHVRLWFALHVVKFTSSYTCHGNLFQIHNFQNLWPLYKTFFNSVELWRDFCVHQFF